MPVPTRWNVPTGIMIAGVVVIISRFDVDRSSHACVGGVALVFDCCTVWMMDVVRRRCISCKADDHEDQCGQQSRQFLVHCFPLLRDF